MKATPARVFLYNTLRERKELFVPLKPGVVSLYTCGPTVYNRASIGNMRAFIFSDTLARTLTEAGYRVRRVINITDVGHLVGDGDEGEDKMAVGATREHMTPEAIASRYTTMFLDDIRELGIDTSAITFPRATEYIKEQIALAKTLEDKGYAYRLPSGLYFDTSAFPNYGRLCNIDTKAQEAGARVEVAEGKRHPADFVLWRTAKKGDLQKWDSPWGSGNPGWHIECSAMSRSLLGEELDIHTGGEDHIAVHHNNEIAQSEASTGRPFVHTWMHCAFLSIDGKKISKSLGNVFYLSDLSERGYNPLAFRYFLLQAHYRTPLSFTWEALDAAASALDRLWKIAHNVANETLRKGSDSDAITRFLAAIRDDLGTPQALSTLWETLKSEEYSPEEKWRLIEVADAHLGLSLTEPPVREALTKDAPPEVRELLARRKAAREDGDYAEADRLRVQIEKSGWAIEDTHENSRLIKA